jgi:DNA-binding transcriptional MerR regulator
MSQKLATKREDFRHLSITRGNSVQHDCDKPTTGFPRNWRLLTNKRKCCLCVLAMATEALVTVSELAAIVTDRTLNDDLELVTRQLRYWTSIGLLTPAEGTFTGKGKHRRYETEVVPYRAAILVRFAALGLSTGALSSVNDYIDRIANRFVVHDVYEALGPVERFKHRQKSWISQVERSLPMFFGFRFLRVRGVDAVEATDYWYHAIDEMNITGGDHPTGLPASFVAHGAPAIFINLTDLFARISRRLSS